MKIYNFSFVFLLLALCPKGMMLNCKLLTVSLTFWRWFTLMINILIAIDDSWKAWQSLTSLPYTLYLYLYPSTLHLPEIDTSTVGLNYQKLSST